MHAGVCVCVCVGGGGGGGGGRGGGGGGVYGACPSTLTYNYSSLGSQTNKCCPVLPTGEIPIIVRPLCYCKCLTNPNP